MYCPHCNCYLDDDATFCPHCGSDYNTGFKEGADFSDLDDIDYDEIIENEFGNKKRKSPIIIFITIFLLFLLTISFYTLALSGM